MIMMMMNHHCVTCASLALYLRGPMFDLRGRSCNTSCHQWCSEFDRSKRPGIMPDIDTYNGFFSDSVKPNALYKFRELNQGGPAFWRRAMDYAGEPPPEEQVSTQKEHHLQKVGSQRATPLAEAKVKPNALHCDAQVSRT